MLTFIKFHGGVSTYAVEDDYDVIRSLLSDGSIRFTKISGRGESYVAVKYNHLPSEPAHPLVISLASENPDLENFVKGYRKNIYGQ